MEYIKLNYPAHRQREEKTEEYAAYNAYCEECKDKAKNILFGEIK